LPIPQLALSRDETSKHGFRLHKTATLDFYLLAYGIGQWQMLCAFVVAYVR